MIAMRIVAHLCKAGLPITLLAAVLVGSACAQDAPACYPGDYTWCVCGAGTRGLAACNADRNGYGACDCSGLFWPDAGPITAGVDGGGVDSGLLPFLAGCSDNSQCSTGLCFHFNAKGSLCTKTCMSDSDCPGDGCSLMGVCKAP